MGILEAPAVEEDFGWAVGDEIVVAVRDEEEVWGGTDEDPAEAGFDAAGEVEALGEDRAGFEGTVAVAVGEDDDAVAAHAVGLLVRIAEPFEDPETSGVVDGEGDGLDDVWFSGDEVGFEAVGEHHAGDGLLGGGVRDGGGRAGVREEVPEDRAFFLTGASGGGEDGGVGVEDEVVEIEMAPWCGALVDEAEEGGFSGERAHVDGFAVHFFRVAT